MSEKMCSILLPPDFSFTRCLWFLDRNLDDATHRVTDRHVRKLVKLDGGNVLLEIGEGAGRLTIEVLQGDVSDFSRVTQMVARWFDLDRDLRPFYKLLEADPGLAPLLEFKGLRLVGIPDLFEAVCWAVIGQQINLAFAYKIKRRMVEMFGEYADHEGERYYRFPDPETIRDADPELLRSFQLSGRKAEYLSGISGLFASGEISAEKLAAMTDESEMIRALMAVRGIGEWTAHYALLKGMYIMNAVPFGDVGIDTALLHLKGIPRKGNRQEVGRIFERFEGWRSYLVLYLWQSLRTQ